MAGCDQEAAGGLPAAEVERRRAHGGFGRTGVLAGLRRQTSSRATVLTTQATHYSLRALNYIAHQLTNAAVCSNCGSWRSIAAFRAPAHASTAAPRAQRQQAEAGVLMFREGGSRPITATVFSCLLRPLPAAAVHLLVLPPARPPASQYTVRVAARQPAARQLHALPACLLWAVHILVRCCGRRRQHRQGPRRLPATACAAVVVLPVSRFAHQ